jgi:hypothetical protein
VVYHVRSDAQDFFALLARQHRVLGGFDGGNGDGVAIRNEKLDFFFQRLVVYPVVVVERRETGPDDSFDRLGDCHGF